MYEENIDQWDDHQTFKLGAGLKLAQYAVELKARLKGETHRSFVSGKGIYSLSGLTKIPLTSGNDDQYVYEKPDIIEILSNEIIEPIGQQILSTIFDRMKNSGKMIQSTFEAGCQGSVKLARAAASGINNQVQNYIITIINNNSDPRSYHQLSRGIAGREIVLPESSYTISICNTSDDIVTLPDNPLDLQINCDTSMLESAGLSVHDLPSIHMARYNEEGGYWEIVTSRYDSNTGNYITSLTQGGVYALVYDQAAPVLKIIHPQAGVSVTGNFTFEGIITDLVGLDFSQCEMLLDGNLIADSDKMPRWHQSFIHQFYW